MMKMNLPQHKREYLESIGFAQTYKEEPRVGYGNKKINMEKWSKFTLHESYHLYIHFTEDEPAECELYHGEKGMSGDCFSERNLISNMKKRGFE